MSTYTFSEEEEQICQKDSFCRFVSISKDFTTEEKVELQRTIISKRLSRILNVSASLAVWSMLAAWVDAVILPFIIVYTVALPGANYYALLFPVVWTILNAFFKFIYVRRKLGDAVKWRDSILAVFPYAGAAFLLKNWFVGDPLLRKASISYINDGKKHFFTKVKRLFKRGKKNNV